MKKTQKQNNSSDLNRCRTILDGACDGFLMHDLNGSIFEVNSTLCNWLGYEREEILTLNLTHLNKSIYKYLSSTWEKVISQNSHEIIKTHFYRKNGSKLIVETKLSSLREGNKDYIIAFMRECGSSNQTLGAPDLTQFALDNAANPTFWYKTKDPKFFYVNKAACDYLGYTQKELLSMWTGDINPTYTMQTFHSTIRKLSERKSLLFETKHMTKSGRIVPVEVLVKMVEFEGDQYVISFVRDITLRKNAEEELRLAKRKAERANNAKSTFLANMSHEIRTPLTAIIGFANTGLQDNKSMEQRVHSLQTIRRSGDHLLHLINDILDFSKIEAGEMDIEKASFNIFGLITDIENMVIGQATRKELKLFVEYDFPLPLNIHSDALRLKQIMLNLCNNAIKFTDKGEVKVTVTFDDDKNQLKLQVIDTGIGLSNEQAKKIFKPFKQADVSTTRQYGGTGLGLSLSRRLIELLDGEITVRSEPGKGSAFQVALNLQNEDLHSDNFVFELEQTHIFDDDPNKSIERQQLSGEILLAEDDALNQELISVYLSDMGANVTIAENGQVAVDLGLQKSYDLIYMDMQMPLLSGYDAVKTLRANNYTHPIVMLTANATLEDRSKCKLAGCDDFLTKPIDEDKLYEATARFLKLAK